MNLRSVCIEVHAGNMPLIIDFLTQCGFTVNDNPMGPRDVWNVVFTR